MAERDRHPDRSSTHLRSAGNHRPSGRPAPPRTRHTSQHAYSHLRVEIDLKHELPAASQMPFLRELESLLRERQVEERESLLDLAAALLRALAENGFTRVDHWEVEPGGWLPLPEETHPGLTEPVAHLLRALRSDRWEELARADAFLARLSGPKDQRVDVVLRRVHRERDHTLSLDLSGRYSVHDAHQLVQALRERLSVLRVQITDTVPA